MKKFPLLLVALLLCITAFAQPIYTLSDSAAVQIKSYALLPDRGYNFEKILADPSLPFSVGDSLRPAQVSKYWLKLVIANPFREAIPYNLQIGPALNNTLYYYDANARNWVKAQAGIFSEKGKLLATATLSIEFSLKSVGQDQVIGVMTDAEGHPLVRVIPIRK